MTDLLIICLYVDNLLVTRTKVEEIVAFKKDIKDEL